MQDFCQKRNFVLLYNNFGRKPVGVESIYQLLELQSAGPLSQMS